MNTADIKVYLYNELLNSPSSVFLEYWEMWGKWLGIVHGHNDWDVWYKGKCVKEYPFTFEGFVESCKHKLSLDKPSNVFSRLGRKTINGYIDRQYSCISIPAIHSVKVLEKDGNISEVKWYGCTASYFADYPDDEEDLALKAVYNNDMNMLIDLNQRGIKVDGGYNHQTLLKAVYDNNIEMTKYLLQYGNGICLNNDKRARQICLGMAKQHNNLELINLLQ